MQNKVTRFLLFFLFLLIVMQLFSANNKNQKTSDDIELILKNKIALGSEVQVQIKNHRTEPLSIPFPCPKNPLKVERYENGEWNILSAEIDPTECKADPLVIEPNKAGALRFGLWSQGLFKEPGRYRVSLVTQLDQKEKVYSREFDIKKPGVMRWIFNNIFYRPIFNTLVYLISIIPYHDLGWGIILLTIIIKLLLLGPNQKAMKSQKAMQKVQPELDALKLKYAGDQQRLAQETMALWKKYKVSPLGSCLPILIQFPILIALFYVVKDGLNAINPDIFYAGLKDFDPTSIQVNFLNFLDLTKKNIIILPVIVGGLQFLQMRLAFAKITPAKKEGAATSPFSSMNKVMLYMMPVMIAVFTAGLPAAVGFYWATSTLFGIGQQIVVNRMKD